MIDNGLPFTLMSPWPRLQYATAVAVFYLKKMRSNFNKMSKYTQKSIYKDSHEAANMAATSTPADNTEKWGKKLYLTTKNLDRLDGLFRSGGSL